MFFFIFLSFFFFFKNEWHNKNYLQAISKLCVLAKFLEKFINSKIKDHLYFNNILLSSQSGFQKQHSTVTASLKVLDDVAEALDAKDCFAAVFRDLFKTSCRQPWHFVSKASGHRRYQ